MKLYIKQKVFSWGEKFTVKDEYGNDKYFVEGEIISLGKKLHIKDSVGNEIAFIAQKLFTFLPKYQVFIGDTQVAEIVKQFTVLRHKYTIEGLGWDVDGDFLAHDYTVSKGGMPIATITKEWMTWGDSYVIHIENPVDEITALAIVIAIDCVRASQNN